VTAFSNGIIGQPVDITTGPEGDLWFTVLGLEEHPESRGTIGRITPAGVVTEFAECGQTQVSECVQGCCFQTPSFEGGPFRITAGLEGDLWFTEFSGSRSPEPHVGRMTAEGTVTNFAIERGNPDLGGITLGREGDLWVAECCSGRLGRVSPLGVVTQFQGLSPTGGAEDITTGPEGDLWFTENTGPPFRIGRITPTGTVSEFSRRITGRPFRIAAGPDGNMWFTEFESDQIGRISPRGNVTEFSQGISPGAQPFAITAGPHDTLWFTEASGQIGRVSDIGHVKLGRLR
jgi:streptogramin lyase